MPQISIRNLSFRYNGSEDLTLSDISLDVEKGEFLVITGESGSGKTTLAKMLKPALKPFGETTGEILFEGEAIKKLEPRKAVSEIGFVMQNPDSQIVCDSVLAELCFGLQNIGVPKNEALARIAEISSYFGITDLINKKTAVLSGGQKQILNLAAITAAKPKLLILDEPTSQLDPVAEESFFSMIRKLNRDMGVTVILIEHRLDEIFGESDRLVAIKNGKIVANCDNRSFAKNLLSDKSDSLFLSLPSFVKIAAELEENKPSPINIKEMKAFLSDYCNNITVTEIEMNRPPKSEPSISAKNVYFRYSKGEKDVLTDFSLTANKGEILSLIGGNGSGKTTALGVLSGSLKPQEGKVKSKKLRVAVLPQNPEALFLKDSVFENLKMFSVSEGEVDSLLERLFLKEKKASHPYDLSGGEQQRLALIMLLLSKPDVLLLDEPTKGLDFKCRQILSEILFELKAEGKTIILVTHDLDFSAEISDRAALMFGGRVAAIGMPSEIFSKNSYYTTKASKMSAHLFSNAVTAKEVLSLCKRNHKPAL